MKKFAVLFVLFILPIVAYLFFASGINSFGKLPTITKTVPDLENFRTATGEKVTLNDKITILAFAGTNMIKNQGNFFNFTEQIYDRNKTFKDFQVVVIAPNQSQNDAKELKSRLSQLTDISGWKMVFGSNDEILQYHKALRLKGKLDADLGTKFFYIIDKKRNLRGRNDEKDYKEGYNTFSPSDLHNEMTDDVKIILAEYRFALKRNNNKRQI
ncbi:MAG: hypothetical protein H7174_08285 [Flavobacterium sp.]|nr:hypothetical protein [Flavobacterium sp.]